MKLFLSAIGLLVVGAFCVFGFMATFEPTNEPSRFMAFRVGYAVIGLGCLAGVGFVIMNAIRR